MSFNWLDILLLVIIALTVIAGISKGLVRQCVGILAVVIGLILALMYYPFTAELLHAFVSQEALAQFLGFLVIFFGILAAGWLVSAWLSRMMKGPFKFLNHVLGGLFGLLKGTLICGVLLFAMLVFPVNTKALHSSRLAPVCLRLTKAVFTMIPEDLKDQFNQAYKDIVGRKGSDDRRI